MNEAEQKLSDELKKLNANLEALFAIIQSDALAEALEVAKDLRTVLAKLAGYRVK